MKRPSTGRCARVFRLFLLFPLSDPLCSSCSWWSIPQIRYDFPRSSAWLHFSSYILEGEEEDESEQRSASTFTSLSKMEEPMQQQNRHTTACRLACGSRMVVTLIVSASLGFVARGLPGAEIEGFTEPYRTRNVSTTETGIVTSMEVREGHRVEAGQVIAKLDRDVQEVLLALAKKNVELKGRLESAQAELGLQISRLSKLEELFQKGHARQEEVERTRADVAIARGHVLAAEEEMAVRQLEYERTVIQLKRRVVESPAAGVVSKVLKEVGEFVAPTDPHLVEIVQLDQLLATFSVASQQAASLTPNQAVQVRLADTNEKVPGVVEFVAPVTDAESGTVRVKVRLDNADGRHRSGQRCGLALPAADKSPTAAKSSAADKSPAAAKSPTAAK